LDIPPGGITSGDIGPSAPQQMAAALAAHADESHRDSFVG
jgi:hypothetical protein